MSDTTIKKIDSQHSPIGGLGQKHLASGKGVAMRLWSVDVPGDSGSVTERPYETVGYVIEGRAELHSEGQMVVLGPGDSWVVPKGAKHAYRVEEPFVAIEATHPPAHLHDRDEA